MDTMTTEHERWHEFYVRLAREVEAQGCTSRRDRPRATYVLTEMDGFDVPASLAYFETCGGYCDCEILMNVVA